MKDSNRIYVATSGFYYDHWKGPFYPEDLPKSKFLQFYIERFNSVELNNPFYRLPNEAAVRHWHDIAPEGFIYAVKASRVITHIKRLKDAKPSLELLFERIAPLKEKLGPILFQLPPNWKVNTERLEEFLKALPKGGRHAFEFRDTSWFEPEVYELLRKHNAAFCIYDFNFVQSPKEITADFIYLRLHGPAGPYSGSYSDEALRGWAADFRRWIKKVKNIYCYFDNDQAGFAALNALTLKKMIEG